MSLIFSQELAASVSALNEPECEPSPSAKSTPTAGASSPGTGQMSLFTTTCEPLPQPLWASPKATDAERGGRGDLIQQVRGNNSPTNHYRSMSSAAGSPARTSATPARAQALPASAAGYGKSTPELLARFDPYTSSWKTSQHCFIEGLQTFSETFPRSGTMRNGTAYALPMLVPHTGGTGFGSLPTHSIPTPTASDHIERRSTSTETLNFATNKSVSLDRWVKYWPTPSANEDAAGTINGKMQFMLTHAAKLSDPANTAAGGQLNPTWVEWLMGFPLGWTALDPLATPSSRKSRS